MPPGLAVNLRSPGGSETRRAAAWERRAGAGQVGGTGAGGGVSPRDRGQSADPEKSCRITLAKSRPNHPPFLARGGWRGRGGLGRHLRGGGRQLHGECLRGRIV